MKKLHVTQNWSSGMKSPIQSKYGVFKAIWEYEIESYVIHFKANSYTPSVELGTYTFNSDIQAYAMQFYTYPPVLTPPQLLGLAKLCRGLYKQFPKLIRLK